ncbi:MAG: glycosyltransferase family 39 protein, partial [Gemmataceae bacterium]|nr:glycosyltransferase family 39 protein [Gemmataceae bacterium]
MTRTAALFLGTVAAVAAAHLATDPTTEPFFHNDESRHVMTGVFVRDALYDLPTSAADPKGYAVGYFRQYPALGLITWPPFFYAVEGVAMAACGTSYTTARCVLAGFVLLGGWYFFRLMARTHGRWPAALGLALFLFAPLVYEHSRRVMLEVPALALVLASVFHFERYLDAARRRDAVLACLFAALAALTRFDGVVLLPYFLVRLVPGGRLRLLLRRPVLAGVALALALTVPYYLFTLSVYGGGIGRAAGDGTRPEDTSFLDPRNVTFYPACLPDQVGWPVVVAALVGLIATARRPQAGPYLALAAATYLTFTPLAELEPRHTIYWVPAVAGLAAAGAARATGLLEPL